MKPVSKTGNPDDSSLFARCCPSQRATSGWINPLSLVSWLAFPASRRQTINSRSIGEARALPFLVMSGPTGRGVCGSASGPPVPRPQAGPGQQQRRSPPEPRSRVAGRLSTDVLSLKGFTRQRYSEGIPQTQSARVGSAMCLSGPGTLERGDGRGETGESCDIALLHRSHRADGVLHLQSNSLSQPSENKPVRYCDGPVMEWVGLR